jgi:hypothetical protein
MESSEISLTQAEVEAGDPIPSTGCKKSDDQTNFSELRSLCEDFSSEPRKDLVGGSLIQVLQIFHDGLKINPEPFQPE